MYIRKMIRQNLSLNCKDHNADCCEFICISQYIPNLELLERMSHPEIEAVSEELLNYNQNTFTQLPLDALQALSQSDLSQTSEPYLEAWQQYAQEAQTQGVATVLKQYLVQLHFPIESGMSETAHYQAATRQGVRPSTNAVRSRNDIETRHSGIERSEGCCFQAPDQLSLKIHASIAGLIPVIIAGCRADFVMLIQALTRRNEPTPIPLSMGACMVSGYNNWERVFRYRHQWTNQWIEQQGKSPSESDWNAEFKQLIPHKDLYQDRFMILSTAPYSHVTAAELDMTEAKWSAYSLIIRLEHECTHYFTLRFLKSMKNHLLDELIADYRGIVAAIGYYRADWFLRFMGLEQYPNYRLGGRLENYRGSPSLSDQAFQGLQTLVKRSAENLEQFDRAYRTAYLTPQQEIAIVLALTQSTLIDLASESGQTFIAHTVDQILCKR